MDKINKPRMRKAGNIKMQATSMLKQIEFMEPFSTVFMTIKRS